MIMEERIFRYGEGGRGVGVVSLPAIMADNVPVLIALNAGLMHRGGPYRLNVLTCRKFAELGYIGLRVDLSGKGETPPRQGLSNRESVQTDWEHLRFELFKKYGKRNLLIMGLCSGADNAIKIAAGDTMVKGVILLDPVASKDRNFNSRAFKSKILNRSRWLNFAKKIVLSIKINHGEVPETREALMLRDLPNDEDIRLCFSNLVANNGKVIAVFTHYAVEYYNLVGQYCRGINVTGLDQICEEIFWPDIEHIYPVQAHRAKLIETIAYWGKVNFNHFCVLS